MSQNISLDDCLNMSPEEIVETVETSKYDVPLSTGQLTCMIVNLAERLDAAAGAGLNLVDAIEAVNKKVEIDKGLITDLEERESVALRTVEELDRRVADLEHDGPGSGLSP